MSILYEMPGNMSEGQPLTNSNITSQMDFLSNLLILSCQTSWAAWNSVNAFSQGSPDTNQSLNTKQTRTLYSISEILLFSFYGNSGYLHFCMILFRRKHLKMQFWLHGDILDRFERAY